MRPWEKAAMWAFILLVCAGVGAFVASRSNPFPPEVRGRSTSPTESPSPSVEPVTRWNLAMTSRTTHAYHVGGSCTSDWRMGARIRVSPRDRVEGHGTAHLLAADCDFPTAQVQAEAIAIRVVGVRRGEDLRLRMVVDDVRPRGAQDLGGFVRTLPRARFSIEERARARSRESIRVEDPADEVDVARWTLVLSR